MGDFEIWLELHTVQGILAVLGTIALYLLGQGLSARRGPK